VLTYAPDDMKASFEYLFKVGMGRRIRLPRRAVLLSERMMFHPSSPTQGHVLTIPLVANLKYEWAQSSVILFFYSLFYSLL